MSTQEIPILGPMTAPDASGDVFFEPLETAMTLSTAAFGTLLGCTMQFPTGSDIGFYGKFNVPPGYVDTPVLVIRGVLDGTPASILAFGFQQLGRDDSESIDIALETADLASNSSWTGYADKDLYEETIAITPAAAFVTGDEVFYYFFRDDSVDTQTTDFILTGLFFRFEDA